MNIRNSIGIIEKAIEEVEDSINRVNTDPSIRAGLVYLYGEEGVDKIVSLQRAEVAKLRSRLEGMKQYC